MSSAEDFDSTEDFESEEIGVTLKTVTGGRGNTKKTDFQVMLISKSYTYPILSREAIGNLIPVQSISSMIETKIFWSLRNLF